MKMADHVAAEKEYREKLLRMVKKEVKQIMEEAVTRKFVHEESSSITSLCEVFVFTAAVDACLSHGLKRRALGLFKTNSTTALLQKLAKDFEGAALIARIVEEIEAADPNNSDSTNKVKHPPQNSKKSITTTQYNPRYLWIRLALFNKLLAKIVDHLVKNSSKYYEKEALIADPVSGQILASLLVGPCALDYSKMKTQDHFWTDPRADELVQRHRLSSGLPLVNGSSTPPSNRRPGLQYRKDARTSGSSESEHRTIPYVARDYVESLHQNSRSTLLYGKNNVLVQPRENIAVMPGYLSLHQTPENLTIKWTPNQLMNGCYSSETWNESFGGQDKSIYWEFAMSFNVDDIVYLHCHQHADTGGTVVLVGQDGVQQPPIHFPKGGHLLAFLSCLENGLLPHGQLDPPLWSQRGKGKVFPKLRRKGRGSTRKRYRTSEDQVLEEEEEAADYVFRIVTSLKPDSISQEMMDPKTTRGSFPLQSGGRAARLKHLSSSSSSTSSSKSLAEDNAPATDVPKSAAPIPKKQALLTKTSGAEESPSAGESIQVLCNTMRRQIISRAFYGWLAHCRHLRTVRTHLSGLVNATIVSDTEPTSADAGLTSEVWKNLQENGCIREASEIYRLTYFGGIEHGIRKEVWPYLLGHYQFGSTAEERKKHDDSIQTAYETTMSEWLAVEAIVRQQDKEVMEANLAKLSSESTNSEIPLVGPKDANLSNEVFEDVSPSESFEEHETSRDKSDIRKGREEVFSSSEEHYSKTTGAEPQPISPKYIRGRLIRHYQVDSQSQSIIVTNPSVDINGGEQKDENDDDNETEDNEEITKDELLPGDYGDGDSQLSADSRSSCISPASSSGGVYSMELLDQFSLNLHRIEKDVQRCDRNYWYFRVENLEKLRNVMCTYVWEHLDVGYVQGMCDLVAPLLVIFDDEVLTYSCFCELMKRMAANFPHGGAMDAHFANMRSLIQILDGEMFELMHKNGDYTHFYFCYRWFLLDFKRELLYDDIFSVWETIWAAKHIASSHFVLFIALAMVEYYRDIILENNMDFTDIIKFFNEMAERHDAKAVLKVARELVHQIQTLIDNK
ncbi:small G protein signaling modulator 1-like isoform X4 [Tachypleus tridentatus]|uniref:small G protein signaling modulator 1-like isoform X4 n=1 Tax=Tachypleus tridentatus TaxID=6853 RepID=UPI003FD42E15